MRDHGRQGEVGTRPLPVLEAAAYLADRYPGTRVVFNSPKPGHTRWKLTAVRDDIEVQWWIIEEDGTLINAALMGDIENAYEEQAESECKHTSVYDPGDPENGPCLYCSDCGARLD